MTPRGMRLGGRRPWRRIPQSPDLRGPDSHVMVVTGQCNERWMQALRAGLAWGRVRWREPGGARYSIEDFGIWATEEALWSQALLPGKQEAGPSTRYARSEVVT